MRVMQTERLIDAGAFSASHDFVQVEAEILRSIVSVTWPPGANTFTIYPQSGKKRGEGNGVKPIKQLCMRSLEESEWELEGRLDIATHKKPGPIDAVRRVRNKFFALEWETGNVSSSHRALNKMAIGILQNTLVGGVLIIPTRELAQYLTDRIGNFPEIEPYFPLWRSIAVPEGLLQVIAIEHDAISDAVPRIPKGTDGRASV
jgi:hypothetical protein